MFYNYYFTVLRLFPSCNQNSHQPVFRYKFISKNLKGKQWLNQSVVCIKNCKEYFCSQLCVKSYTCHASCVNLYTRTQTWDVVKEVCELSVVSLLRSVLLDAPLSARKYRSVHSLDKQHLTLRDDRGTTYHLATLLLHSKLNLVIISTLYVS